MPAPAAFNQFDTMPYVTFGKVVERGLDIAFSCIGGDILRRKRLGCGDIATPLVSAKQPSPRLSASLAWRAAYDGMTGRPRGMSTQRRGRYTLSTPIGPTMDGRCEVPNE